MIQLLLAHILLVEPYESQIALFQPSCLLHFLHKGLLWIVVAIIFPFEFVITTPQACLQIWNLNNRVHIHFVPIKWGRLPWLLTILLMKWQTLSTWSINSPVWLHHSCSWNFGVFFPYIPNSPTYYNCLLQTFFLSLLSQFLQHTQQILISHPLDILMRFCQLPNHISILTLHQCMENIFTFTSTSLANRIPHNFSLP